MKLVLHRNRLVILNICIAAGFFLSVRLKIKPFSQSTKQVVAKIKTMDCTLNLSHTHTQTH